MAYSLEVAVKRDGVQVGFATRDFPYDGKVGLEQLTGFKSDVAGEAISQAYEEAGINQFPQGGENQPDPATRSET